jgi:glycosyltransferase involved in cell wall biosynthesis
VPAHHVVVVGGDSDPGAVEHLATGYELVWCPDLVRQVDPRREARALGQLVALMREGSFDVVHTHQSKAGLLGRVAARRAQVPVVYHSASGASFGAGYGRVESAAYATAERVTAPLVSRYFVVGTDLVDRLARNGISPRRLHVVRSSLDLRRFAPADPDEVNALRSSFGVPEGSAVVCYVGRLEDRKGVETLPDLLRPAADVGPVTLLVAGDGPARAELARRARDADLGFDMRLLGHLDDVADMMRAADLLVLPSPKEGLPQVLVQAAACELPFVAYDVDGVHELLDLGAPGRMVPLGDQGGLAAALTAELQRAVARTRTGVRTVDPARWAAWDPAFVAGQYRDFYARDVDLSPADPGRSVTTEPGSG